MRGVNEYGKKDGVQGYGEKRDKEASSVKDPWEMFENLNEYVYAADASTYELIFMNKKLRNKLGVSLQDAAGRKCYEILNSCSTPCTQCSNGELSEGKFKEWWRYDPKKQKYFALKDTVINEGGRRIRIEFAFDLGASDWQHSRYQDMEVVVNEGLRAALMESTPDKTINVLLEYLGKVLDGERTYIFEKNLSGGDDNTYEWTAAGITPEKDNLQQLPPEVCANWYRNFKENKSMVIPDVEETRKNDPIMYNVLKPQGINSLVVVPLYEQGKVIGFFGVDNPPEGRIEYAENLLQIIGHFISSSLKRRNLVRKLEIMSFRDHLTGFGNRYSMQRYVREKLKECEAVGVVYCDITGLKATNDREGHEAGDRYILRACESLSAVFDGCGLFRMGGDELLVICPQIRNGELEEKLELLKNSLNENSVIMAVGIAWRDSHYNIDEVIREAETLMYEDKASYYREMGVDRRK